MLTLQNDISKFISESQKAECPHKAYRKTRACEEDTWEE
jgi:hypothetical protein